MYVGRDPHGRPVQRSRTFRGKARAAARALDQFVAETAQPARVKGTFGDLAERWYQFKLPRLKPSTARMYRSILDNRLIPEFGAMPVERITVERVDGFYSRLAVEEVAEGKRMSPRTIERHHAVLRMVLNAGVRWGDIAGNVATRAERPAVVKFQAHIPTPELAASLLIAAHKHDPDLGSALWVAAATGMRRGEVCGLRWSRVDLDAGTVTVDRAVTIVPEVVVGSPKSHQRRTIDLDPATVEVLRRHRARQQSVFPKLVADPYVFSRDRKGRGATPPRPDWLTGAWRRLRNQHGAPQIRLHDLRHFMASVLLDSGVPIGVVSARLGHAKESTTSDIYSHVMPGAGKQAAISIGNVLGPAPE